jgi:hypothetical protein
MLETKLARELEGAGPSSQAQATQLQAKLGLGEVSWTTIGTLIAIVTERGTALEGMARCAAWERGAGFGREEPDRVSEL